MTLYHCTCDPHGDNAKCNRECCGPKVDVTDKLELKHLRSEVTWLREERNRLAADLAKAHQDAVAWIERANKLTAELQLCKAGINDERDATGTSES